MNKEPIHIRLIQTGKKRWTTRDNERHAQTIHRNRQQDERKTKKRRERRGETERFAARYHDGDCLDQVSCSREGHPRKSRTIRSNMEEVFRTNETNLPCHNGSMQDRIKYVTPAVADEGFTHRAAPRRGGRSVVSRCAFLHFFTCSYFLFHFSILFIFSFFEFFIFCHLFAIFHFSIFSFFPFFSVFVFAFLMFSFFFFFPFFSFFPFFILFICFHFHLLPLPLLKTSLFSYKNLNFTGTVLRERKKERTNERTERNKSPSTIARTRPFVDRVRGNPPLDEGRTQETSNQQLTTLPISHVNLSPPSKDPVNLFITIRTSDLSWSGHNPNPT